MEKYEFKYYRKAFAVKLVVLASLIGFTSQIISETLTDSAVVLGVIVFFIGGICFVVLAFYGLFGANAQGVGILHDEYDEIKLKEKEYHINYDKTTKITEKVLTFTGLYRRWHIRIKGEPTIVLRQGSGFKHKTNLYPLENFMKALYKRLKPEQYY
jgi:hypothetical protein